MSVVCVLSSSVVSHCTVLCDCVYSDDVMMSNKQDVDARQLTGL